jgi:hypothetical protein
MYNGLTRSVTQAVATFPCLHKTASKKIKDRGIHWLESYHDKSETLKKKLDAAIGPNAYLRFSGHDVTTNSDYFIVIGPSVEGNQKLFFAGIQKMPRDDKKKVYSPYGEYFSTIKGAMAYAQKKWGLPFKQGIPDYSADILVSIDLPEHIKG